MASHPKAAPGGIVEKLMTTTRREFEASLARLAGLSYELENSSRYALTADGQEQPIVFIDFEELPKVRLSPLMRLPQARVTIHLETLSESARADFIALFDKTFQRGGG